MEFAPFRPVPPVPQLIPQTNFNFEKNNGKYVDPRKQRQPKVLKGLPKGTGSKYAFVEKHRLMELRSDLDDSVNYFYDHKSRTIFEINNYGPVVFMKANPEVSKHLIELNGL
jgi:hypothetical protein